jgi:hypothetical protein
MKKVIMPLAALAIVSIAGTASAQCNFDVVMKSKGVKSSMIRAYAACPSTEYGNATTSETGGGVPACEPVTARKDNDGTGQGTVYNFGEKGTCDVQTKGKINDACEELEDENGNNLNLPMGACHVVEVKAKCKDILQDDEATPINETADDGWSLATLSRATLNDNTNGDMTVIDFPVTFFFDPPKNGGLKLKSNSAIALADILTDPSGAALPTCSQIQVVSIIVKDPAGREFATLGAGTATEEDVAP